MVENCNMWRAGDRSHTVYRPESGRRCVTGLKNPTNLVFLVMFSDSCCKKLRSGRSEVVDACASLPERIYQ